MARTRIGEFARELLRRKVVRLLGAYIAILWLLAEGFSSLFPVLGIPVRVTQIFIVSGVALIPVLALLSWKYNLVPPQLVRDVKDIEEKNPVLSWAMVRHDTKDAGYILLSWNGEDNKKNEKRFFQPISIGRDPKNDVELPDARVSRHHAVLWAENGTWQVRDLDSANGTFIGHTRVKGIETLPQSCDMRFHANGPIVSVYIAKTPETLIS